MNIITKLQARLAKEQALYKEKCHEDRIRLPRKMYFSSLHEQMRILHRIAAIKTAIEVIENGIGKVDVYSAVLNSISPKRTDYVDILEKAQSIYLRERALALKVIFEDVLPVCKREIIAEIQNYLPKENLLS